MKKKMSVMVCLVCFALTTQAQIPIIGTVIAKVIKAIDLKVQRLQNQTLVLQNVQKEIENNLHKLKLQEISDWSQKQKNLYQSYFTELRQVKKSISHLSLSKNIAARQMQMVNEYRQTISKLKSLGDLSVNELNAAEQFYVTVLNRSFNSFDAFQLANSNSSLSDAGRIEIINRSSAAIDECLELVRDYNTKLLVESERRKNEKTNISVFKQLNGLP